MASLVCIQVRPALDLAFSLELAVHVYYVVVHHN